MCIAIMKPAGKHLTKETLAQCFKSNPDGAGFMYSKDGQLKIHKGFFAFENFYQAYLKHEDELMLIHFRIKTHGKVAVENCHPFFVTNNLGFIHNGIISHHSGDATQSDTRLFNRDILKPLVSKYGTTIIFTPMMKALIEDYISYSKLVFLDVNGNYSIFNENKGVWDDDVWYSNTSYKPYVPTVYIPPKRDEITGRWASNKGYPSPRETFYPTNHKTYYLERSGQKIQEDDDALVVQTSRGVHAGTRITVLFISEYGKVDIELPNGVVIPSFPGDCLGLAPTNAFDDTFSDELLNSGFAGF